MSYKMQCPQQHLLGDAISGLDLAQFQAMAHIGSQLELKKVMFKNHREHFHGENASFYQLARTGKTVFGVGSEH